MTDQLFAPYNREEFPRIVEVAPGDPEQALKGLLMKLDYHRDRALAQLATRSGDPGLVFIEFQRVDTRVMYVSEHLRSAVQQWALASAQKHERRFVVSYNHNWRSPLVDAIP